MATDATKTIKQGDSNITSAVREFWSDALKERIYAKSIPRGLIDSVVKYVQRYEQGVSNTFNWTISEGITTTATDRYDVATADLEMNQVEYGVTEASVSAAHKAGFVAQKVDILQDQEGFVVPNILDSLSKDMAIKESNLFMSALSGVNETIAVGDAIEASLVELRKGTVTLDNNEEECTTILMSPNTIQSYADEMLPANTIGDNAFLRRNTVGSLFGANVVKSTYVADNEVFYFADEAMILFERKPYTLTTARDNITDLYVKFAIEARFGIGVYDSNRVTKSTFVVV